MRLAFDEKWKILSDKADEKQASIREKAQAYYNTNARDLKPFSVGTHIHIQDTISKKWDRTGIIVGVGERRNYRIKLPSGRVLWRNRRYLRRFNGAVEEEDGNVAEPKEDEDIAEIEKNASDDTPSTESETRRSSRPSKKPVRLGIDTS